MKWPAIVITCCLGLNPGLGAGAAPAKPQPYLTALDSAEAAALLDSLKDAQTRLRAGERLTFRLLSGAPATYPMADVSALDAFLGVSFDTPLRIRRVEGGTRGWQPFVMVIAPDGLGKNMWNIEVVTTWNGRIERVEMEYGPPPPF